MVGWYSHRRLQGRVGLGLSFKGWLDLEKQMRGDIFLGRRQGGTTSPKEEIIRCFIRAD